MKINSVLLITIVVPLVLGFTDSSVSNLDSHILFLIGILLTLILLFLALGKNSKKITSFSAKCFNTYKPFRNSFFALGIASIWTAWMYGVILGVMNGAEPFTAVFNFSGIYAYILYFVLLLLKPNPDLLIKIISWVCYVFLAYSVFILFYSITTGYYDERILSSFNDVRVLYAISALCVLAVIGRKSWEVFVSKENKTSGVIKLMIYLMPAIITFLLFFSTFSKGYFLACAVIIAWFIILGATRIYKSLTIDKSILLYMILTMVIAFITTEQDIYALIKNTISEDNPANTARAIQSKYLYNEFTLFGSGLGVKLQSGFLREDSGVQFELMYHNIIHKLGILSLLILLPIASWVYICLKDSTQLGIRGLYGSFSFGLLAVVFVSYGNPILFSLQSVILQCIALYILSSKQNRLRLGSVAQNNFAIHN